MDGISTIRFSNLWPISTFHPRAAEITHETRPFSLVDQTRTDARTLRPLRGEGQGRARPGDLGIWPTGRRGRFPDGRTLGPAPAAPGGGPARPGRSLDKVGRSED